MRGLAGTLLIGIAAKRVELTDPVGGDPDGKDPVEPDSGRAGAFLLSDAAAYVTGAALQVDGGLLKGML